MNIEEEITKCEIALKQIKQYDPDPYYVDHFFNEYMISVNNIIEGIFELQISSDIVPDLDTAKIDFLRMCDLI